MYFPSFGGGQITDIESVGDGFIRFKNGYQICWGLELEGQMNRPSTTGGSTGGGGSSGGSSGSGSGDNLDGGIMHDGGIQNASVEREIARDCRYKTIKFPAPFTITPYIVISPVSSNSSYQVLVPAAWYYNESMTGFTAELYAAVKLTWIAIGKWK